MANTLANPFRNGVAGTVTGAEVDLYLLDPADATSSSSRASTRCPSTPSSSSPVTGRATTGAFGRHREQIERVEQLSAAHHLRLGSVDTMASYLLEITHHR